ncbi:MAG: hypothetical protein KO464_03285 [Candidatus Methanofastidiosum sp.]|nr:hypothetical protein [Methanofastidiosum sp.]
MWEYIWLFFICTPLFLLPTNYHNISIKTKIVFFAVFYILLYSNMGYAMQFLRIRINIFSVLVAIGIIDSLLFFYLIKNNKIKNIRNWNLKKYKNISKTDIVLTILVFLSFFLYYYNQSKFFSFLGWDSWYWFSGLNYIGDNGFLFHELSSKGASILQWYPDGFHYLWGITFLPFPSMLSYNAVKIIIPIFGALTVLGLWEYFSDNKNYLLIASIIYYISMPHLIYRFSMFLPEPIGIFMIVFTCLVLKKYEFNNNVIMSMGIVLGLFTNIYHSTGLIIFFILGIIVFLFKSDNSIKYLFFYLLGSIFFLIPYILDPKGFLEYNAHIVEVKQNPKLWNNWIKEGGIIFYRNHPPKYTPASTPLIGFPLSLTYLSLFFKDKLINKSILFSLFLMVFTLILYMSYYFYETSFASRAVVFFSISSALLFPSFVKLLEEIFNKHFKNKYKKIIFIFLILLTINRVLIVSFEYPNLTTRYITEESKMLLWMDDNLPLKSTVIIEIEQDFYIRDTRGLGTDVGHVTRILYPRKIIFRKGDYNIKNPTYHLFYDKLYIEKDLIHRENDLVLVEEDKK